VAYDRRLTAIGWGGTVGGANGETRCDVGEILSRRAEAQEQDLQTNRSLV
jgi:hypothetical protein